MKKVILIYLVLILPSSLFAQKEITLNFGSGIFNFVGVLAVEKSYIILEENRFYYTGFEAYSRIPSISFNLSSSFLKVDSSQFIYGVNAGFDYFNNIIYVDKLETDSYYNTKNVGSGKVLSKFYEISLSPFAGKRFNLWNFKIDVIGGVEIASPFYAADHIQIVEKDGNSHSLLYKRKLHAHVFDFRPNFKLACSYKKIGFFGQYLIGQKNYASDNKYDAAYSKLIRFGINYLIYKS